MRFIVIIEAFILGFIAVSGFSHRSFKRIEAFRPRRLAPLFTMSVQKCVFSGRGNVILSREDEKDFYLRKTAILLYEHGAKGSYGLIQNKPGAFPIGEMAPGMGPFASNTLYMGGNDGGDTAIMIHKYDLGGSSKHIGNGIFIGGMKQAREMVESFKAHPKEFKFVFNNVFWGPGDLVKQVENGRWGVFNVSADIIVSDDDIWDLCNRH